MRSSRGKFYKNNGSARTLLHSTMSLVLMFCKIFGIFPVTGLFSRTGKLRLKLNSPYSAFCVMALVIQASLTMACLVYLARGGVTLRNSHKLLFQASGTVCCLNILFLAKKWPGLVTKVARIEDSLIKSRHRNIVPLCKFIATVMFCGALVDLVLGINLYTNMSRVCFEGSSLQESYYRYTMPSLATVMSFSPWSFYPLMMLTLQATVAAQISDMAIIIIGIYLSYHFENLYDLTVLYKDKYPSMWHVIRVHHSSLVRLVRLIDDAICPFLLVSFGSNLSLICAQLYKILKKPSDHVNINHCDKEELQRVLASSYRSVYYITATLLVVSRTLASALCAAKIHIMAMKPAQVLYDVPSHCYNAETRRLIDQILSSNVALSGFHFFYVTRGMIITMIGTVITYELVMLQFS